MAIIRQVILFLKKMLVRKRQSKTSALTSIFLSLLLFSFINVKAVHASPTAPTLIGSDWTTGELTISWEDVTPGNTIILYTMNYHNPNVYTAFDAWTATSGVGFHIVRPFENGQTVWYYIVQVDPSDGSISPQSDSLKQTPPITAFITNFPDWSTLIPPDNTGLLTDIKNAIEDLGNKIADMNTDLGNKIDAAITPSPTAKTNLQNAIDDIKDAVGAGQVDLIGGTLKTGFDGGQPGMVTPVNNDDGVHTFTGGANPSSVLPLDGGTDTPLTFRIPLTNDMSGNPVYVKIFTAEQLEKLQWLTVLRKVGTYIIWIIFSVWVVSRFTPAFKV